MEQKQLEKLMEMSENNKTMETTFFETQRTLSLLAKHSKYLFDACVREGFTENQAITVVLGILSGKNAE